MRVVRTWLLLLLGTCAAAAPVHAQTLRASELQAGFLLKFLRFTSWPAERFESPESPIVVTVVGDAAVAEDLEVLSSMERPGAGERPVVVRSRSGIRPGASGAGSPQAPATAADLRSSHLVFVGRSNLRDLNWILRQVEGMAVLTVSDQAGFAERGGMLELAVRSGRMGFDANPKEIDRAGVSLSSKVLRLARIVDTRGE